MCTLHLKGRIHIQVLRINQAKDSKMVSHSFKFRKTSEINQNNDNSPTKKIMNFLLLFLIKVRLQVRKIENSQLKEKGHSIQMSSPR